MGHTTALSLVVVAVVIGLGVRIGLLGIGAARLRMVPRKWQRWILGNSPETNPQK
jgi:hypothetical protein